MRPATLSLLAIFPCATVLSCAVCLAPLAARAALTGQSPEAAAVSADLGPLAEGTVAALAPPRRRRPPALRPGILKGDLGGKAVDLRFDHRTGRVTGSVGGAAVDLAHDRAAGRVTGTVGSDAADLAVATSEAGVVVAGRSGADEVHYEVLWKPGTARGRVRGRELRLDFTMEWSLRGDYGGRPISLDWNGQTVQLEGTWAGEPARAGAGHVRLAEFMTFIHLFL